MFSEQMNQTSPVFSLFGYSFLAIAWENVQTTSASIQYQCILLFLVIWLGMMRLYMGIQVM